MICSKCGTNVPDGNMFCVKCGNKLGGGMPSGSENHSGIVCAKCGAALKPNDKFCVKCGTRREVQPAQQAAPMPQPVPAQQAAPMPQPVPAQQAAPMPQPMPAQQAAPPPQPMPAQQAAPTPQPMPMQQAAPPPRIAPARPVTPGPVPQPQMKAEKKKAQKAQKAQKAPKAQQEQSEKPKKNGGLLIALVVLFALLFLGAAVAGWYFFIGPGASGKDDSSSETSSDSNTAIGNLMDTIKDLLPFGGDKKDKDDSADKDSTAEEASKADVVLLEPAEDLTTQAKKQLKAGAYAGSGSAMELADQALTMYMQVAEENQLQEKAKPGIEDAFEIYLDSVLAYCDSIKKQGVGVEAFQEINNRLTAASDIAATAAQKGYVLDGSKLETYKTELVPYFRDEFIVAINAFTQRENWSRDEAWTCAERAYDIQKDGKTLLFDDADLDDPLRMRYVYCLARITIKRCETGLKDGTMTAADAVNSIAVILPETDYNLLLLQEIVNYGKTAGMDVTKYNNAYDAIVRQIKTTQGLTISADIAVNSANSVKPTHFWYFNDLDGEGKYKVNSNNGTTAATRKWIRDNVPGLLQ